MAQELAQDGGNLDLATLKPMNPLKLETCSWCTASVRETTGHDSPKLINQDYQTIKTAFKAMIEKLRDQGYLIINDDLHFGPVVEISELMVRLVEIFIRLTLTVDPLASSSTLPRLVPPARSLLQRRVSSWLGHFPFQNENVYQVQPAMSQDGS